MHGGKPAQAVEVS